ncbi:SMP-30/gluconolaconase/LRE-like region [Leptospira langatensis]|uniref:SMP-30/gluconolaconase/LRE-like region n=2 Tax=Leptospira langatensis TaxID=2484983 RepID=A0A5F1ZZA2_9LEPT|nr:SMP-30/gluconolaconase/LRE-like region [Leptospira langatensis]TGL43309.1 SMP-30/gluconolaconase/LRE-like region [Leptospira langatensis]
MYKNSIIFFFFFCVIACNPGKIKIGKAYSLGETPAQILALETKEDPFLSGLKVEMKDLPGHDDVIFDEKAKVAYASGMDGWIWKLDRENGKASQWVRPPVNPAGMRFSDEKKEKILVCASRLGGETYEEKDRVGLYEIEIASKKVQPLVLDLPKTEKEEFERVYKPSERTAISLKDLNPSNSRPISLCNDLAVSKDGNRIYITEPFERENAAMGSGAVPEAIGLFPHGKLWMYDRKQGTITLVLDGFTFIDGILLEEDTTGNEESVLFTETSKFRLLRAYTKGPKQGNFEILFENLPGLADGLDRDNEGRIWIGIIKRRSGLMNFVHKNPWLKSFLLSVPQKILPISKRTGFMVLDRKGAKALYYSMHDGSKITDISVAVPFEGRVYFPSFDPHSRGLYSLSISELGIKD